MYTHTHTHTHIYIYIYTYMFITESFVVKQKLSQHYKSTILQLKSSMTEERKDCYISLCVITIQ